MGGRGKGGKALGKARNEKNKYFVMALDLDFKTVTETEYDEEETTVREYINERFGEKVAIVTADNAMEVSRSQGRGESGLEAAKNIQRLLKMMEYWDSIHKKSDEEVEVEVEELIKRFSFIVEMLHDPTSVDRLNPDGTVESGEAKRSKNTVFFDEFKTAFEDNIRIDGILNKWNYPRLADLVDRAYSSPVILNPRLKFCEISHSGDFVGLKETIDETSSAIIEGCKGDLVCDDIDENFGNFIRSAQSEL